MAFFLCPAQDLAYRTVRKNSVKRVDASPGLAIGSATYEKTDLNPLRDVRRGLRHFWRDRELLGQGDENYGIGAMPNMVCR